MSKHVEERDANAETHYQLYKLLAFAIQELDWFANERNVSDMQLSG